MSSYVTLSNGVRMPVLGLGTWKSDPLLTAAAVEEALLCGYRHIDTAWIYFNQKEVGEGIRRALKKGIERSDIFITSKLWMIHYSPDRVAEAVNEILSDLGLSYLDQIVLHWPVAWKYHPEISDIYQRALPVNQNGESDVIEDFNLSSTWKVLEDLYETGILKSIGLSNFNQKEVEHIISECRVVPHVLQIEVHPFLPQTELAEYCSMKDIQIVAYSPLGSPGVKGVFDVLENRIIASVAKKHETFSANIAIRWSLQRGFVVIPKSTTPERIRSNVNVFGFELTDDEMIEIGMLSKEKTIRAYNPEFRAGGVKVFM